MKHLIIMSLVIVGGMLTSCKEKTQSDTSTTTKTEGQNNTTGQMVFQIDPQQSTVNWIGAKPAGTHNGTVPISSGSFTVEGGNVTSGTIVMDMKNLKVLDPAGDMGANLEVHLKGLAPGKEEDFFNVDKFPTSTYNISSTTKIENEPEATHIVNGTLTIKNITKPVNFKAKLDIREDGVTVVALPFSIDRTEFDIKFKSLKFFDNLKDDFVNDEFQIGFNVVAKKK
jgi:polyisoprenoid-binding protein YceI